MFVRAADQKRARLAPLHPFDEGELVVSQGFFSESIIGMNVRASSYVLSMHAVHLLHTHILVVIVWDYLLYIKIMLHVDVLPRPAEHVDI